MNNRSHVRPLESPWKGHDPAKFTARDVSTDGGSSKIELDPESRPLPGSAATWGSGTEVTALRTPLGLRARGMGTVITPAQFSMLTLAGQAGGG